MTERDFIIDKGNKLYPASWAAKMVGYTNDHVARLARQGEIPGKLIGRTWYVDLPSLYKYKENPAVPLDEVRKNIEKSEQKPDPAPKEAEVQKGAQVSKKVSELNSSASSLKKLRSYHQDIKAYALANGISIPELPVSKKSGEQDELLKKLSKEKLEATVFTPAEKAKKHQELATAKPENSSASPSLNSSFFSKQNSHSLRFAAITVLVVLILTGSLTGLGYFSLSRGAFAEWGPSITRAIEKVQGFKMPFFSFLTTGPQIPTAPEKPTATQAATTTPSTPDQTDSPQIASTEPLFDVSALKDELLDFIEVRTSKSPVVVYTSPAIEQVSPIIYRTVTYQSDSDVSTLSNAMNRLANGGTLNDNFINNAHITDSTFSGSAIFSSLTGDRADITSLTFTSATGTNATTTNLFSTLGTFDSLLVNNDATITGNFTVGGDTTTIGQLVSTRIPTLAHSFLPSWPDGTSNASDATIYINPASAVPDTNIFAAAVGGAVKFLVDAEGDVYANSLVLLGSVSQGETTIAGNLTVQDNVTLGDASTDLITFNGQLLALASTTLQNFTAQNSTTTNATTTTFFSTTGSFTDLFADTFDLTNLTFISATGTNATTTNFFSTTASSTNLFSTSGSISSLTAGALTSGPATFTGAIDAGLNTITSGLINSQTISSTANFTGTMNVATSVTSPSFIGALTGNASTATALQTIRTIWGQNFDGTANVSGALTGATTGAFSTSISTPSIITASGALGITPAAGSNLNINLSTTGDFAVNTNQLYVDTSTGNVGVGTTTPLGLLHVEKTQNADTVASLYNYSTGSSAFSSMSIGEDNTAKHVVIRYANSGVTANDSIAGAGGIASSGNIFTNTFATGGLNLAVRANAPIRFFTGGIASADERMRIDGSGNVGIGTTGSEVKLQIVGEAQDQIRYGTNLTAYADLWTGTSFSVLDVIGTTDTLEIRNDGVAQFKIDSSGSVGIGTTAPQAPLSIRQPALAVNYTAGTDPVTTLELFNPSSDIGTGPSITFGTYYSGTASIAAANISTERYVGTGTSSSAGASDLVFKLNLRGSTALAEVMRIDSLGNVGIGTTNPGAKLDIAQSAGTAAENITASGDGYSGLSFGNGFYGFLDYHTNSTNGVRLSALGPLRFGYNTSAAYGSSTFTEVMRINNSGYVGIGTTNPSEKLSIYGTDGEAGAGSNIRLYTKQSLTSSYQKIFSVGATGTGVNDGWLQLLDNGTATVNIAANNSRGGNTYFNGGGNVGIGTTDPGTKLEVKADGTLVNSDSGQIRISGNTDSNMRLLLGYDTTGNYGWIQATQRAVDHQDLILNALGGSVGIGTTDPGATLDVRSSSGSIRTVRNVSNNNNDVGNITLGGLNASSAAAGYATIYSQIVSNTAGSESGLLHFNVLNAGATNEVLRISNTGSIRFNAYGAGTLTTDGSGNITASSDERLKNIQGEFDAGLDELVGINPILYKWNSISGMETEDTYAGFSAQNIQANIPEAVGIDSRGYLTLSDRPITAALVNGVKELNTRTASTTLAVEGLKIDFASTESSVADLMSFASTTTARLDAAEVRISDLESILSNASSTPGLALVATTTDAIADSVFASASDALRSAVYALNDAIVNAYATAIYATSGIFDKVFARSVQTDMLCVGEACVTEEEFLALLNQSGVSSADSGDVEPVSFTDSTAPNVSTTTDSTTSIASSTPITDASSTPAITDNTTTDTAPADTDSTSASSAPTTADTTPVEPVDSQTTSVSDGAGQTDASADSTSPSADSTPATDTAVTSTQTTS